MSKSPNLMKFACLAATSLAIALGPVAATAQEDPRDEIIDLFAKNVVGKKVAWAPVWMGVLESEWTRVMKERFADYGIELTVRDSNFKSDVQLQTVSTFINEKPDILIVQNPSTTLLARELKRAVAEGIKVVQVSMQSNTVTDAFVGADVPKLGRQMAELAIEACGQGKGNGKVAIIEGDATTSASIDVVKGINEGLAKDSTIKIVSSQPANWDANKAAEITTNILQQHDDLCALIGVFGPMTAGAAQVIKNAGKQGQVKVFVASDGQSGDCNLRDQGLFTSLMSYRGNIQGEVVADAVLTLLQDNRPAGTQKYVYYTTAYRVDGPEDRLFCYGSEK